MKKFFIISLIPIFVFLFPLGLIGGSFFLTGCSVDTPSQFNVDYLPPDSENLFSKSRYPYINEFFGTPTTNDFLNVVRWWADTNTALKYQGYIKIAEDESSITDTLRWAAEGFAESQEEVEAAEAIGVEHPLKRRQDAYITMLEMMTYTGFSEVLNEVWAQLGVDWLNHHLVPILDYWFMMDEDMYRNDFLAGIQDKTDSLGKISEADYDTLIETLGRMLDDDDETYGIIWDALPSAWDIIDTLRKVEVVDVGDLTANINSIIDSIRDAVEEGTEEEVGVDSILTEVGKAVTRVWENENNEGEIVLKQEIDADGDLVPLAPADYVTLTFQEELRNLLHSVGLMMSREIDEAAAGTNFNTWDSYPMTDLSRVLFSAEDLLDDSLLPRATLRSYLEGILATATEFDKTSAMGDGADSLNGILGTYYNPVYFSGFDYGVDYAMKHNMNNQLRTLGGADKTSALRTVLHLVEGFDADDFGSLVGSGLSSPGGMVSRGNMLDFAFGEAATANAALVYDDAFRLLDYLLYGKRYEVIVLSVTLFQFDGFFGMLESFEGLLTADIIGPIITAITSGMDFTVMPSAYVLLGIDRATHPDETGYLHQMFFFPRVIEHFYFQPYPGRAEPNGWNGTAYGWEHEVVDFAVSLSEIPPYSSATPFNRYNFATDPGTSVMKALEGPYGYGLATYALRDHSSDASDDGLLDPVLYMLSMVVDELINTSYDDPDYTYYNGTKYEGTLWAALMDHIKNHKLLGLDVDEDYDEWIPFMFDPDDNGDVLLEVVHDLLTQLHVDIDTYAKDIGQALIKLVVEDNGAGYEQIKEDIEFILDILDLVAEETDLTSFEDIILYLLEENEDGSDNKFIANIKAIFIKLLDLKVDRAIVDGKNDIERIHGLERLADESPADYLARKKEYEDLYTRKDGGDVFWLDGTPEAGVSKPYNGSLNDDATLCDLVEHLFGEDENLRGGLYSASNVKDFVDEMFDDSFMTSFWFEWLIEEPLNMSIVQHAPDYSYNNKGVALVSVLGLLFFNDPDTPTQLQLPYKYLKEGLFRELDIDGNGIVDQKGLAAFFRAIRWETDFTGLLEDDALYMGGEAFKVGGDAWETWKGLLAYYTEGESIW